MMITLMQTVNNSFSLISLVARGADLLQIDISSQINLFVGTWRVKYMLKQAILPQNK